MKCPKCNSERFTPFAAEGIHVDFCRDCHALWFEKGELADYLETREDLPNIADSMAGATNTDIECPACPGEKLVEFQYHPDEHLRVDYCNKCHGILFDQKEVITVEKIIAKHNLADLQTLMERLKDEGYSV